MHTTIKLSKTQHRLLIAIQYWNCSRAIFEGMKRQLGTNDFHFLISVRSFLEYTRRGIWFLAWASDKQVCDTQKLTFNRSGSPALVRMDEMINEAMGLGRVSHLCDPVMGITEPFIDCLHALTHGNPIAVRILAFGLDKIFQSQNILIRAELELDLFSILVFRSALGLEIQAIWKTIASIYNRPDEMKANARIAAAEVKKAGLDKVFQLV